MSISEYIKRQRVSLAKDLLRFTSRSVQDISVELGFCNSSYFIRVFREITGMSPKEYRG